MSFIELDPIDRDQWQAQITHFFEQPIQRGLIQRRAADERLAVFIQRDGLAAKPVGPFGIQVTFDTDLVSCRPGWIRFPAACLFSETDGEQP